MGARASHPVLRVVVGRDKKQATKQRSSDLVLLTQESKQFLVCVGAGHKSGLPEWCEPGLAGIATNHSPK